MALEPHLEPPVLDKSLSGPGGPVRSLLLESYSLREPSISLFLYHGRDPITWKQLVPWNLLRTALWSRVTMDEYTAARDPRIPKRPKCDDFASNGALCRTPTKPERTPLAVPPQPSVKQAPAPFQQATADIILRSSDAVDFRVRSAILAEASRVFRNMLSPTSLKRKADNPDDPTVDGLPVIRCAERAELLYVILLFCYPIEDPDVKSGQSLCDVLKVALNYEMDYIVKKVIKQFTEYASKEPLKMYMHACRHKWPQGMAIAARASLGRPIQPADLAELEDVENKRFISALELLRLQSYHKTCGHIASNVIGTVSENSTQMKLPWLPHGNWVWFNCPHRHPTAPVEHVQIQGGAELIASRWWTAYLRKAQEKLRCRPSGGTLLDTKPFAAFAAAATEHCTQCKRQVIEDLLTFNNLLAQEVEKAIEEVRLACARDRKLNQAPVQVDFDHKSEDKAFGAHLPITPWSVLFVSVPL